MIKLLTAALSAHLNIGQQSTINTSSIFMSLETLSVDSLANKQLRPCDSVQIRFPSYWPSNITNETLLSLRV